MIVLLKKVWNLRGLLPSISNLFSSRITIVNNRHSSNISNQLHSTASSSNMASVLLETNLKCTIYKFQRWGMKCKCSKSRWCMNLQIWKMMLRMWGMRIRMQHKTLQSWSKIFLRVMDWPLLWTTIKIKVGEYLAIYRIMVTKILHHNKKVVWPKGSKILLLLNQQEFQLIVWTRKLVSIHPEKSTTALLFFKTEITVSIWSLHSTAANNFTNNSPLIWKILTKSTQEWQTI